MIDYTLPLDQLPDPLPIEPLTKPFDVTITPPGSKSITCRAYVLAALAEGESRLIRPLRAEDTDLLLDALCTLGAEARWEGEDVLIKGVAGRFPRGGSVYLGDGGTPTRFMIACACLAAEPVVVDASPRMRERPIAEGVEMLRQLGATIEYVEEEGRLPVRVVPSERLRGGTLRIGKTISSQFVSAVLLIGACLPDGVTIEFKLNELASPWYLLMTKGILMEWQIIPRRQPKTGDDPIHVQQQVFHAREFTIELDVSSAVYWWLAAAIVPDARTIVEKLFRIGCCQPDIHFLDAIQHCLSGALRCLSRDELTRPSIEVRGARERTPPGGHFGFGTGRVLARDMPDAAIAIGVYAATVNSATVLDRQVIERRCAEKGYALPVNALFDLEQPGMRTLVQGLQTLRVKETDRLVALANELRKVGCTVETGDDWISIEPGSPTLRVGSLSGASSLGDTPGSESRGTGTIIETYNDHRMAMAFAVLGLVRPGISIRNPACVKKSYPTFWKDFARLYG